MSEGTTKIEQFTGADLKRWQARATEFMKSPDRRVAMIDKLVGLLRYKFSHFEESVATSEVRQETDESGLETYFFGAAGSYWPAVGISIFPKETQIHEVTIKGEEVASSGEQLARLLTQKEPHEYHFITTGGMVGETRLYDDKPLLGVAREGRIIAEFKNKDSASPTNEYESGGLVSNGRTFDVVTFSELKKRSTSCQLAEQGTFVAEHKNWQQIARLPAYYNRKAPLSPVLIGYFVDPDGERRNFVAESNINVPVTLLAIEKLMRRENFVDWQVACLDVGGVFAGMVRIESDGTEKSLGPSTFGKKEFADRGHERTHFYEFSWPRGNQ